MINSIWQENVIFVFNFRNDADDMALWNYRTYPSNSIVSDPTRLQVLILTFGGLFAVKNM